MNALKSAIESEIKKRKSATGHDSNTTKKGSEKQFTKFKKYMRLKDLEKQNFPENEDEGKSNKIATSQSIDSNADSLKQDGKNVDNDKNKEEEEVGSNSSGTDKKEEEDDSVLESFKISEEEMIKRFRSRGEPIKLFGETDRQRKIRLRTLEIMDEKSEGQQNEFMKALREMESGSVIQDLKKRAHIDTKELQERQNKIEMLYKYNRDQVKLSAEGKRAAATQHHSSESMKPLFRLLNKRALDMDVLARITEIAKNIQEREYSKANDAYLRLSIGNAPWPIGVTMVGIHERSARENIFSSKVARKFDFY
ncbi:hypothetical protein H4219_000623 [Mycoemilia scoparia]|uniref:Pre-mRNA-splicing factor 18 n=1 Tax=Mycoemilia scoparia TaxID=417184 RepID=A0A9W8A3C6_9FUNG|nr:hypothetical protein H4219_000623 [Mycoemilia scoparia]